MAPFEAPQRPALTGFQFPTATITAIPTSTATSTFSSQDVFALSTFSIDTTFATSIISSIETPPTFSSTAAPLSAAPLLATSVPSFPAPYGPIVRPPEEKPFISMSMVVVLFGVIFWGTLLGKMYYGLFWVDTEDEAKTIARQMERLEYEMEIELMDWKGTKEISV